MTLIPEEFEIKIRIHKKYFCAADQLFELLTKRDSVIEMFNYLKFINVKFIANGRCDFEIEGLSSPDIPNMLKSILPLNLHLQHHEQWHRRANGHYSGVQTSLMREIKLSMTAHCTVAPVGSDACTLTKEIEGKCLLPFAGKFIAWNKVESEEKAFAFLTARIEKISLDRGRLAPPAVATLD